MKAVTKYLFVIIGVVFAGSSLAQTRLELYVSPSGSAAIAEVQGNATLLVLAGGNDNGAATSGNCVVFASLEPKDRGFEGKLLPVNTSFNSYGKEEAEGKGLIVESDPAYIDITSVDDLGICPFDNSLVNHYELVTPADKRRKIVFSEMIELAHADALSLYKNGNMISAIAQLSPYAENYDISWLSDKDISGVVVSAINDYAYFLQENNQAQDSIPFLNSIVMSQPNRAVAWLNLADSNWALGNRPDAIKQYAQYKKLMLKANKKANIPSRVIERSVL